MNDVIDNIINIIKKKDIKIITIAESNHRSYTSHTFQFELAKKLYDQKLIDTFGSERLGVIDADIINWYLRNSKEIPKNIIKKLPFGGMGYSRIIDYLHTKDKDSFKIVGLEEDDYCHKALSQLSSNFDMVSPSFLDQIRRGVVIKKLKPITENDKRWYESLVSFRLDMREEFWLKQIQSVLEVRKTLFINGFHLGKNDPIGRWLKKNYKGKVLFLGMGAKEVKTQLLLIPSKVRDFGLAIYKDNYKQKIVYIDDICKPTKLEKSVDENEWKMVKVTKKNEEEKVRAIGCYLAMYEKDYLDKKTVDLGFKIKKYDYVILFDKNEYRGKMFY
jgi:hypothetical protein